MKKWKILVLGVTGNLAKLKILPGISQFAYLKNEYVQVDLVGYSRSRPDPELIEEILDSNSPNGKHNLNSVSFFQGEYTNVEFFDAFYSATENAEEELLIYMAVPPSTFLQFLKTSCPHYEKNIHIILEKPFGRDIKEAQEILQTIQECKLGKKVLFLDHYLFKSPLKLSKQEQVNLRKIESKEIQNIKIVANEEVGVETRTGYYDQIGAIKDMFQHLFSLIVATEKLINQRFSLDFFENISIKKIIKGQYNGYTEKDELKNSTTETYFMIQAQIGQTHLWLESGKRMPKKVTEILVNFEDGNKLIWNLTPTKVFEYFSENNSFTINLNRSVTLDHTNVFIDILEENYESFVSPAEMLTAWWVYQEIERFVIQNKVSLFRYNSGEEPLMYSDHILPIDLKNHQDKASLTDLEKSQQQLLESLQKLLSKNTNPEEESSASNQHDKKVQL